MRLTYYFQSDTLIHSLWNLHRRWHSGADHKRLPWIPDKAKYLDSLDEAPTAHLPPGSIWVSASGTSPWERRLRAKQGARHIHRHIHHSKRHPIIRFLSYFSAKHLVQIRPIRTLRVCRESNGHSKPSQYVHLHPVCGSK